MHNHYVPRHYLRLFESEDNPGMVWRYVRVKDEFILLPIMTVGLEVDFYSEEDERWLNEDIEIPAQDPLKKLREGKYISDQSKHHIARYLNSMINRGPRTRQKLLDMVPTERSILLEEIRRESRQLAPRFAPTEAEVLRQIDDYESKTAGTPLSRTNDIVRLQWVSPEVIHTILNMTWKVLIASGSERFLTGDNPVFFPEELGLQNPDSEFSFPLSPKLALHGSGQKSTDYFIAPVFASSAQTKEINRRTIFWADRFVFSHLEASWVRAVANNSPRQWNRILI